MARNFHVSVLASARSANRGVPILSAVVAKFFDAPFQRNLLTLAVGPFVGESRVASVRSVARFLKSKASSRFLSLKSEAGKSSMWPCWLINFAEVFAPNPGNPG